jgi:hypothetical protein
MLHVIRVIAAFETDSFFSPQRPLISIYLLKISVICIEVVICLCTRAVTTCWLNLRHYVDDLLQFF